jgi:hypothetical protein
VKLKHVRRLSGEVEEVYVTLEGKTNNFVNFVFSVPAVCSKYYIHLNKVVIKTRLQFYETRFK